MKLKVLGWFFLSLNVFVLACRKEVEILPPPIVTLSIEPLIVKLAKEEPYGIPLKIMFQNTDPTQDLSVDWSSENPRIARVTSDGVVWPEGAGETFVVANMRNGKAKARCRVIITDGYDYKYRLVLKDKGSSDLSLSHPEAFLSSKAIQRRRKYGLRIDQDDFPISPQYLRIIRDAGGVIVAKSKWLNTVSVHCSDQFLIDRFKALPFVKDVELVWQGKRSATQPIKKYEDVPQAGSKKTENAPMDYGAARINIGINSGQYLHEKGFRGAGIDIAVIDAGFKGMNNNPAFRDVHIKGAKSFVYENDDPYSIDEHGVWVTSCMAVNMPGYYVGTAPQASYWLFRTEDQSSEYPIEEDYWINAAEYADSAGVDIINSSLSYTNGYSFPAKIYTFKDMDGKTALASRAANIATRKGILIVNCAGNNHSWVGTPADSPNVLTVGAVDPSLNADLFTAYGVTSDNRIKPDVMALGGNAFVINSSGKIENRSGTSYASPIMCGLAACLWQAFPSLTNLELMDLIKKSGDRAARPEIPFGHGLPNMEIAAGLIKGRLKL